MMNDMVTALSTVSLLVAGAFFVQIDRTWVRLAASGLFPAAAVVLILGSAHTSTRWWETERLGLTLALTSLLIGWCVYRYAVRQFAGEPRASSCLAASFLVVAAVVATDLSQGFTAFAICWVATSLTTVWLLWVTARSRETRLIAQAAKTFALGDGLLVVGLITATALMTHPSTSMSFAAHFHGAAAVILLATATIAAVSRAGLSTGRSWVAATVTAPTPVSALLHAGVVNAGVLLLLRVEAVTGAGWLYVATLAGGCLATMIVLAPKIHARVDLKGQLAVSTIAQMAFMFSVLALGWRLLALTHLIGHGIYKAGRFMASGGAIESRARLRRRAPGGDQLPPNFRLLGAIACLAIAVLLGMAIGGDEPAAMGICGPAAAVVWWQRTASPTRQPGRVWLILAGGLALYALTIAGLATLLEPSLAFPVRRAPWWTPGAAIAVVVLSTSLRTRWASLVDKGNRLPSSPERSDVAIAA